MSIFLEFGLTLWRRLRAGATAARFLSDQPRNDAAILISEWSRQGCVRYTGFGRRDSQLDERIAIPEEIPVSSQAGPAKSKFEQHAAVSDRNSLAQFRISQTMKSACLVLLFACIATAQQTTPVATPQPNCLLNISLQTAGQNSPVLDNRQVGCLNFTVAVAVPTTVSALQLVVQTAQDNGSASCSTCTWATFTAATGSNPNTSTAGWTSTFTTATSVYYGYLRVQLVSITGTGSITGKLFSFLAGATGGGGGGGGSGTLTQVNTACGLSGGPITVTGTVQRTPVINAQAGASYAILSSDCGNVVQLTNATATPTIAQAGTAGFVTNWFTDLLCTGTNGCVLTPAVSTINGAATLTLAQNQSARIESNGTNYIALFKPSAAGGTVNPGVAFQMGQYQATGSAISPVSIPNCPDTGGNHVNFASGTGVFTCGTTGAAGAGGGITVYAGTSGLQTTTVYFPIGGSGTATNETAANGFAPATATVSNFGVSISSALGAGISAVYTWRDNATSQSLTCTISGAVQTTCQDLTHSFTATQGDLLDIQLVPTGTVPSRFTVMTAQFGSLTSGTVNTGTANQTAYYPANGSAVSGGGPGTAGQCWTSNGPSSPPTFQACAAGGGGGGITVYSGATALAATLYFPIGGGSLPSATEAQAGTFSPTASTVSNFYVNLSAAPGLGNSIVFTWRDATVSQTLTCTISGAVATSCSDLTHTFTTVAGDKIDIQAVTTGTIAGTPVLIMSASFGGGGGGGGSTTTLGPIASLPVSVPAAGNTYQTTDSWYRFVSDGTVWQPFVANINMTLPPTAGWTFDNQAGTTVSTAKDALFFLNTGGIATGTLVGYTRAIAAAPYTYHVCFYDGTSGGGANAGVGIAVSDGTQYVAWETIHATGSNFFDLITWSSSTGGPTAAPFTTGGPYFMAQTPICIAISDDGTNRKYSIAFDQIDYVVLYTEANTTFLTATRIAFILRGNGVGGGGSGGGPAAAQSATVVNWNVTTSGTP